MIVNTRLSLWLQNLEKGVVHFGPRKLEKHIPLIELLPGNFFPDTELLYTAKILKKTTPFINNCYQ